MPRVALALDTVRITATAVATPLARTVGPRPAFSGAKTVYLQALEPIRVERPALNWGTDKQRRRGAGAPKRAGRAPKHSSA